MEAGELVLEVDKPWDPEVEPGAVLRSRLPAVDVPISGTHPRLLLLVCFC